jgi:HK97 family phage prohead protease
MDIERRCLAFDEVPEADLTLETRANGTQVIAGYAAVYDRLSLPLREGSTEFREVILPGAFDKILNRQRGKQDTVALLNHNSDLILGRTSSGTLGLSSDGKGLRMEILPPDTQVGRDTLELVRRRDLRGASFAFTLDLRTDEKWTKDDDGPIRQIREIRQLFDVSVVLTPAYPASSVGVAMRSYQAWLSAQEPAPVACPVVKRSTAVEGAVAALLRLRSAMRG